MKKTTEMMAARAVKVLRESLSQNLEDVKEVLDQFEATHSESEREQSTEYGVLVECQFGLEEVIDKIDDRLNIVMKVNTKKSQAHLSHNRIEAHQIGKAKLRKEISEIKQRLTEIFGILTTIEFQRPQSRILSSQIPHPDENRNGKPSARRLSAQKSCKQNRRFLEASSYKTFLQEL